MSRWEQFEVWVFHADKWRFVASFVDFELASALARSRKSRVRLVRAVYENGKTVQQEVLAEVGATRQEP
jgi:hypothetical protein